jgi:hypothetical protein
MQENLKIELLENLLKKAPFFIHSIPSRAIEKMVWRIYKEPVKARFM